MSSRSQYADLTTIGATGPCGPMRLIFGSVITQAYVLNLERFGRSMCPRPQHTYLTYMGGTGTCRAMRIIFGSVI